MKSCNRCGGKLTMDRERIYCVMCGRTIAWMHQFATMPTEAEKLSYPTITLDHPCKQCGNPIIATTQQKTKQYCSDDCANDSYLERQRNYQQQRRRRLYSDVVVCKAVNCDNEVVVVSHQYCSTACWPRNKRQEEAYA